jgi:hypothetical protein
MQSQMSLTPAPGPRRDRDNRGDGFHVEEGSALNAADRPTPIVTDAIR